MSATGVIRAHRVAMLGGEHAIVPVLVSAEDCAARIASAQSNAPLLRSEHEPIFVLRAKRVQNLSPGHQITPIQELPPIDQYLARAEEARVKWMAILEQTSATSTPLPPAPAAASGPTNPSSTSSSLLPTLADYRSLQEENRNHESANRRLARQIKGLEESACEKERAFSQRLTAASDENRSLKLTIGAQADQISRQTKMEDALRAKIAFLLNESMCCFVGNI